jgi:hypothetical protein
LRRLYICLSIVGNRYLILDSDPKECASFHIDDKLKVEAHVFTRGYGLVRGGNSGQITITTFNEWEPKSTTAAVQCLEGKITCLSTRGGLILAGSDTGQVGGWSYDGTQLYKFQVPDVGEYYYIHAISIRHDTFLVNQTD